MYHTRLDCNPVMCALVMLHCLCVIASDVLVGYLH